MILVVPSVLIYYFVFRGSDDTFQRMNLVKMRDGVHLATYIYLPNGQGPFPFIFIRTPYGVSSSYLGTGYFLQQGIGLIIQDVRGCYSSEGDFAGFGTDGLDALDTINWLKNQSYFNGLYGTYGPSALGCAQYMQVPFLDDVACQAIFVATPSIFSHAMYQGGVARKMLVENWLQSLGEGGYYNYMFNFQSIDSEFARDRQIDPWEWGNVTWPSIHVGGWYDCFGQGIIDGFMGYQYKGGLGGAGNAKLIIGPWTHNIYAPALGELTYPYADQDPWYDAIFNAMFYEKLLGSNSYGDYRIMPNVTYYVMGDVTTQSNEWNRWAISSQWPVPYTNTSYYFQPNLSLSTSPTSIAKNLSYLYDPHNPLATKGGANLMTGQMGPYDQNPVENNRTDILQFEVNITTPLLISGQILAHLFVSSNCTDTDFTAKLMDVYPDNRSMLICDGIIRMRYRNGQYESELLTGLKQSIYEAYIDLWSTSYLFNVGHKLRVTISSSNYPRFDVNPNTGAEILPVTEETPSVIANNTLILNTTYPSAIILPTPIAPPDFVEDYNPIGIHQKAVSTQVLLSLEESLNHNFHLEDKYIEEKITIANLQTCTFKITNNLSVKFKEIER